VAGTVLLWFLGVATSLLQGSSSWWYDYNRDYDSRYYYSDVADTINRVAGMGQALIGLAATLT
jgi:hypothetical protein